MNIEEVIKRARKIHAELEQAESDFVEAYAFRKANENDPAMWMPCEKKLDEVRARLRTIYNEVVNEHKA